MVCHHAAITYKLQFPNSRHQRKTTSITSRLNLSKYECLSVTASFVVSYLMLLFSRLRKKCVQHCQGPRSTEVVEMYCRIYCKGLWVNIKIHTTFLDRHQDEHYRPKLKSEGKVGRSFSHAFLKKMVGGCSLGKICFYSMKSQNTSTWKGPIKFIKSNSLLLAGLPKTKTYG